MLPGTTTSLGIALGGNFGRFSCELAGLRLFPQSRVLTEAPGARGGSFDLWALDATVGYKVLARRIQLVSALGIETGSVFGSGFGVAEPGHGKGLWLAAVAALHARYRILYWFGVQAQIGAALPFSRPWYVIDNVGVVYRSDMITFRGASGLELYF